MTMVTEDYPKLTGTWIKGAPKGHDSDTLDEPYIILTNNGKFEVIGNHNLNGGGCSCCGGGECAQNVIAHAFINVEGFKNVNEVG